MVKWTDKVLHAKEWAEAGHNAINQRRKYTNEPYFVHCLEVANWVSTVEHTEDMIIASLAHDLCEDVSPILPTTYNLNVIENKFGAAVANMVKELTDVYTKEKYPQFNRAQRKELEVKRLSLISKESATIKLADLLSNTASIVEHDRDFALVYIKEKIQALPHLAHGNPTLLNRVAWQTVEACKKLGVEIPVISR